MVSDYKFKISIVMSVYNVAPYIAEAIDSLLAQDIGFVENVQLILVNDGSTDESGSICQGYAKRHESNIEYIEKENGGLSSARNTGLRYVEGELVNFFDPDDTLPSNVLSEVYRFFKRNEMFIDVVFIPLVFFEAKTGLHVKYGRFRKTNHVVSLDVEPWNFVLSSASGFYSAESIDGMVFDEEMRGSEDTKWNCLLFKENPCFGYVCENGVQYNYRQRFAADSIVNTSDVATLTSIEKLLDVLDKDSLPEWQQELMVYELRARLKLLSVIDEGRSDGLRDSLLAMYGRHIKKLYPQFILLHSKFCDSVDKKLLFLSLHDDAPIPDVIRRYSYFSYRRFDVRVLNVKVSEKKLFIEAVFFPFMRDEVELLMFDGNGDTYSPLEEERFNSPYDIVYGDIRMSETRFVRFTFPLKKGKSLRFVFRDSLTGKYSSPKRVLIGERTRFAAASDNVPVITGGRSISFNGRRFRIGKSKESYPTHLIRTSFWFWKSEKKLPLPRLFTRRAKRFILINDRPSKAGDNGEALFRYIVENRQDLKVDTYFVVLKDSPDYKRLKAYGNVVAHGSFKHKVLF